MKKIIPILAGSLALLRVHAATPPINVSLRSSWSAPPLLLEVIETVALENPDAFFPLVDLLTDPADEVSPQSMTPEAIHQLVIQTAASNGLLPDSGALPSVKMNLALHAASPKLQAFYHHYSTVSSRDPGCGSWVDWYGEVVCDVETLAQLAGIETIDPANNTLPYLPFVRPKLLTFDHIFPPPSRTIEAPPRTAIFYASVFSSNFRELHEYILSLADRPIPHVEYVFRYIPPSPVPTERNYLTGYGVSLDLKKMEYLALDDRNTNHGGAEKETPSAEEEVVNADTIVPLLQAYPENATALDPSSPLMEDELLEIGMQSAQLIADSFDKLSTIKQLSQNFPKYATSLARRVVVNESVAEEIENNQIRAQGGISMMWINGASIVEKDVNPFALLRILRKERTVMSSLTSLGLSKLQAFELITHPIIVAAQSANKGVLDGIFDASDRPEEGNVITWWNDLEKDSRYAQWTETIHGILRPLYPGQFHNIKLNMFNIILVLDLSKTSGVNFIAGPVFNIINRNFPFRFGVVPVAESPESTRMARLFYYLVQNYGRKKTMEFIQRISQHRLPPQLQTPDVNWDLVRAEFDELVNLEEPSQEDASTDFDAIVTGEDGDVSVAPLDKVRAYAERLGATLASSEKGHAFINGKHYNMDDNFLRSMQVEVGQQLLHLQEKLYTGELSDENVENISTYFYDLPTTSLARNIYIYPSTTPGPGSLRIVNLPDLFSRTRFSVSPSKFIYPSQSETVPLSIFVVADLDSQAGLDLVKEAIFSVDPDSLTRVSFIHNPTSVTADLTTERAPASWVISHLLSTNSLSKASPSRFLESLGIDSPVPPSDNPQIPLSQYDALTELTGGISIAEFSAQNYTDYVTSSRLIVRELHLAPGDLAVVINGRIVGPFQDDKFNAADFKALANYEYSKRTEAVVNALHALAPSKTDTDRASFAHLIAMSSSIVASLLLPDPSESGLFDAPQKPRQRNYRLLQGDYTAFELGDNTTAVYHVAVLLDPLSEVAQKWSSILEWLLTMPDTFLEVHLNPARYREIPLKRFYRYNLLSSLLFDEEGYEVPAHAILEDLPTEPIYTLGMDVPSSWLVRPREASYDLDNIQLGRLAPEDSVRGVEAIFDLDYLVIEGHARDTHTNSPPRGVQLQLIDNDSTAIDDTQVVANLGYLQFKAKPGVFRLEIREGRGRDIFEMESVGNDGWESPSVEESGDEITLTSFEGLTLYPRLRRVPGMETEDVLAEPEEEPEDSGLAEDLISRVLSIFKKPKEDPETELAVVDNDQADINIFTVASGLLYERFASIMILSVLRNTNSTVKFWFIENFLSPSFLEFIPHLAKAYNFKYELVTYKWPSWLRAQKEKQRIIWAYKILFLDVLFPMDLKKVIFVDADQIVRADLKELVDLDLHGAPYGYTPMGDDNTEMEGFRFWKTGYWAEFLKGRPYHISALYVIDLVRFRQIAAGDILRGQYQQLSADPNSLANLDQDLPNNLQAEVPIFSLPEDWLWCETWCSKDRLHRAKTIDLCQNPLTKEPKLARARQIPEWEEYDAEISQFAKKLAEEGLVRSSVAAADANALAGSTASATNQEAGHEKEQDSEKEREGGPEEGEKGRVQDEL